MKKSLSVILLLISGSGLAQSRIEYANFLQTDTTIKWAAIYSSYVNLTPVNPNFNIRNFYITKLKQRGATAYTEDSVDFAVMPRTVSYSEYTAGIRAVKNDPAKMNWWFNFDDKKNSSEMIFNQESNTCDTCTLKNLLSFFKVKQLLYYRNNQFHIQNILLSPVIYRKNAAALKENTEYFESGNFAFNAIANEDIAVPPTAKFMGRSCNNLVLIPKHGEVSESNILTQDNWNLCHLLYTDIKARKLQAYSTDHSIYPDTRNVLDYRKVEAYKNRELEVPVYDSTGEVIKNIKMMPEVNYDSIYNFTLIQDFYFDFKREILYSKLIALVPRISVITSTGVNIGFTDYWGVIFPKPKKRGTGKTK